MPRHRKSCGRVHAALRGEGGSRRSVLAAFRTGPAPAHAAARASAPASRRPAGQAEADGARAGAPAASEGAPGARAETPGVRAEAPGASAEAPGAGAEAPGDRAGAPGAYRQRLASARSLMVTPWLAAGAGIVIAAAMAVDSPAALTYVPNGPAVRCPEAGCPGPADHPGVATASPGVPLTTGQGPDRGPGTGSPGRGGAAPAYQVGYQILRRWPSGFLAEMTMPANAPPGSWSLRFTFPSAQVDQVSGARWQPSANADGGTATGPWSSHGHFPGHGGPGGPGGGGTGGRQLQVWATGTPTTPSGCRFDGVGCRFG
jgi:hypothetical protein